MADITAVGEENPSPTQDDLQQAAGNGAADNRGPKRSRMSAEDDDDDDDKPGRERRKIEIKFIQDKSRRHITFSKRKAGIMKKVRTFASPCPRLSPVTRVSRIFNPPVFLSKLDCSTI
jgi:MADS-box transcription factor